jgi:hypothetical protein
MRLTDKIPGPSITAFFVAEKNKAAGQDYRQAGSTGRQGCSDEWWREASKLRATI